MSRIQAGRFRHLAADALAEAALVTDPAFKRLLIEMAASYGRLAERMETRETDETPTDKIE
jgi:hypothetical protein